MYEKRELVREDFQDMFFEDKTVLCTRSTQYLRKWVATCNKAMRKNQMENQVEHDTKKEKIRKRHKEKQVEVEVYEKDKTVKSYSKKHREWEDRHKKQMVKHGRTNG